MNREPAYRAGFRVSGVRFCSVLGIALYPLKSAQNRSTLWRSAAQSAAQRSHFFAAGLPFAPQSSVKPLPPPPSEPLAVIACMRKPSAATAIAITALVVAAAGTGAAATHYAITNKNQIAPKVRAQLHGAQGKRGPKGDPGAHGTNGTPGATGATGTYPTVLASGQTEAGAVTMESTAALAYASTAISYPVPINFTPTYDYVGTGTDSHCTGSATVPTASAGYLCVYLGHNTNVGDVHQLGGPDSYGAILEIDAPNVVPITPVSMDFEGSWAVTAP